MPPVGLVLSSYRCQTPDCSSNHNCFDSKYCISLASGIASNRLYIRMIHDARLGTPRPCPSNRLAGCFQMKNCRSLQNLKIAGQKAVGYGAFRLVDCQQAAQLDHRPHYLHYLHYLRYLHYCGDSDLLRRNSQGLRSLTAACCSASRHQLHSLPSPKSEKSQRERPARAESIAYPKQTPVCTLILGVRLRQWLLKWVGFWLRCWIWGWYRKRRLSRDIPLRVTCCSLNVVIFA